MLPIADSACRPLLPDGSRRDDDDDDAVEAVALLPTVFLLRTIASMMFCRMAPMVESENESTS